MPKYRLLLVIFPVWTGKASGHFPPWHSGGRAEDLHALVSAAGTCDRFMVWLSYGSYVPCLKSCTFLPRAGREANR